MDGKAKIVKILTIWVGVENFGKKGQTINKMVNTIPYSLARDMIVLYFG